MRLLFLFLLLLPLTAMTAPADPKLLTWPDLTKRPNGPSPTPRSPMAPIRSNAATCGCQRVLATRPSSS